MEAPLRLSVSDLWFKRAVIYSVDVETFQDSNDDGIGDFPGLLARLDYIAGLGFNCLWLLPFFPSPNRDNGYDVTDYYSVDPRHGTLGDFVEFMRAADARGMRVVIDLVVNHTSDQHPWFQEARRNPSSRYRDFYVWSKERPADADEGVIFPGEQDHIWSFDPEAGLYYLHRFYQHQPDLNVANLEVREEIKKIMGFWLQLGVSGFRVDAAPFLIEHKGIGDGEIEVEDELDYLDDMRDFLSWRRGDAVLLAEANVAPDEVTDYFGDSDRLHMLFDFYRNQFLFQSLATDDATPLRKAWNAIPEIPEGCQWAHFLRNHDELDLGRLSDAQRARAFKQFAPEESMRLYDRGVRRRLAPMLEGDRRRLQLAWSLLFSMPGSPVVWYGEEIGMGDDLSLDERASVRTPMQWSSEENGGFSSVPRDAHARPIIDKGRYSYRKVNVEAQRRDEKSLLNWVERLIRLRRDCPEIGLGQSRLLPGGAREILVHRCDWETGTVVFAHNFGNRARKVPIKLGKGKFRVSELLKRKAPRTVDGQKFAIGLEPYGYHWMRIEPVDA